MNADAFPKPSRGLGNTPLSALSSLVPGSGQQFAMFMLAHLLSTFFDHAAQQITPFRAIFGKRDIIKAAGGFVNRFFEI